jgi:signal transduction histidine kinase
LPIQAAARGTEISDYEFEVVFGDGTVRHLLGNAAPIRNEDGTPRGSVGAFIDITERKKAEEELRQANRLKDDFLLMASHELRTPLATAKLAVQSLAREMRKEHSFEDVAERKFSVVERQIRRLEALIATLLDVSIITEGKLRLHRASVDLADVVREVVDRLDPHVRSAGSEIRLETREVKGMWDRLKIDQALTNLVSNAIKYGEGKPIDLSLREFDGSAVVEVTDHGIGIPAESCSRIFERFERAGNVRPVAGLGLGLWIAKHLVEAHGGSIRVTSEPDAGSTFTVVLPKSEPRATQQ